MTMTEERQLIPEDRCAHRELRDMRGPVWAVCPDCGRGQDVRAIPTVTEAEMEERIEKLEEAAYEALERAEEGVADLEETVMQLLADWRRRLLIAVNDDDAEAREAVIDEVAEEMRRWRA
jgi:hypothetical protein